MAQQKMQSLLEKQKKALVAMLNLNAKKEFHENVQAETVWKLLVYDNETQQIISPILKVNDLRINGVTVNLNINSPNRAPIPDVPAVYFLAPTEENDWTMNLYSAYYLNFNSPISRPLLEALAKVATECAIKPNIIQLYDQYLNFISPENSLFNLALKDSYLALNSPKSDDAFIESFTGQIANSLFNVVIIMGVIPIIRCPRGNAAEMIATKLETRLRDYLMNSRNNSSLDSYSLTRPVLVLLDRNIDLASMLTHSWTYSTMVHDLLDMKSNRVYVMTEEKKRKNFDIDPNDFFWKKNSGVAFPQVAEDVNDEITNYKNEVADLTKSCGVESLEEVSDNTKNLALAITQMPKLTERKRIIDMHMNIAFALMNSIKERQIDALFTMEEAITRQTKTNILEVIKDPSKSAQDKIRLFLVYYLSGVEIGKGEIGEYERALVEAGCNTDSINYVKRFFFFNASVLTFSRMATATNQPQPATGTDIFGKITSKFSATLQNAGVSEGLDSFISGVKNLLPSKKRLMVTRAVDCFTEGTSSPEFDDYLYLDPKQPRNAKKTAIGKSSHPDAIVFVVGGGNYLEYQNLMDYAQESAGQPKNITYGSTEILTAAAFLGQLEAIAKV